MAGDEPPTQEVAEMSVSEGVSAASTGSGEVVQWSRYSRRVLITTIINRPDGGLGLVGQKIAVGGWVKTGREQGKGTFAFLELNDGSCPANLQTRTVRFVKFVGHTVWLPMEAEDNQISVATHQQEAEAGASTEEQPQQMAAPHVMETAAITALRSVLHRVQLAAERSGRASQQVRVVAVSKTKPVSLIRQVYDAGHRYFGENYVQELMEKAPQLPEDIEWHFIGNLQSNKVKPLLASVPNLDMVESVDDQKIANHLDRAVANLGRRPLKVLVQVNTSGEASKSGVDPSGCVELAKHVKLGCPNLEFSGLMTIGMLDYTSTPENFKTLANCRTEVCKALEIPEELCELSMGMSGDFEQAIAMGSTNVRVGSTIFGAREYPKKPNK